MRTAVGKPCCGHKVEKAMPGPTVPHQSKPLRPNVLHLWRAPCQHQFGRVFCKSAGTLPELASVNLTTLQQRFFPAETNQAVDALCGDGETLWRQNPGCSRSPPDAVPPARSGGICARYPMPRG